MRYATFFIKITVLTSLFVLLAPSVPPNTPIEGPCNPKAVTFKGYSFLYPGIVQYNAAYAPFFLEFSDLYSKYFNADIQKDDNLEEWNARFCKKATLKEVEQVVYDAGIDQMNGLLTAAGDEEHKSPLPYTLAGNVFAEVIALNGCTEAVEYLIFAKSCEPFVSGLDGWDFKKRDTEAMQLLIQEGKGRFKQTTSHFFKLRYVYQLVRLAHYCHEWQQTVDIYNELMPQVDKKRPSIVFYWALGHLAGALQKLGKHPEAAHRYALIFRNCPSKRTQAYRSFYLKNDEQWQKCLKLCQSDAEKSTLYALRAGGAHTYAVEDMETIYKLDPENPHLDMLLVSDVQQLEKIFLRTPITDKKYGTAEGAIRMQNGAKHLLELQTFVRKTEKSGNLVNPKLWQLMDGYLELLAGDHYAAEKSFVNLEKKLEPENTETNDKNYLKQIEVWRGLLEILKLDADDKYAEDAVFRVRSLSVFKEYPGFEPFLQDWMATSYAQNARPGKSFMAAYDLNTLALNPSLPILDDLLAAAQKDDKSRAEVLLSSDSNMASISARLLEMKGMYLYSTGEPEAALSTLRQIPATDQTDMKKFNPFMLQIKDCVYNCAKLPNRNFNRLELFEHLNRLEFEAKAAIGSAELDKAADNYYKIGMALYNMSWFGYEWSALDEFRDKDTWMRLSKGTVQPLPKAPLGNLENTDVSKALSYFEKVLSLSREKDLSVKAAFMAARCQQKQWFCSKECKYKSGSRQIPQMPAQYRTYYDLMKKKYSKTSFYELIVKECSWFAAYSKR
jgi:hypothetical protein